jgi:hypothetical protein
MRTLAVAGLVACSLVPAQAWAQQPQLVYFSLSPCRIVDTRLSSAGALTPGVARTFNVVGNTADFAAQGGTAGGCGIPGFTGPTAQVRAVVFNFVAVNPQGAGNLRAWPTDQTVPSASVLNYAQVTGLNIANGLVVPVRLDVEGNDISIRADASGTHVVVDVVGYFAPLAITANDLPVIPISRGGTGSTTQSFVDLSTTQTIAGNKTFSSPATFSGTVQVNGALTTGSPGLVPIVGQDANLRVLRGVIIGATCTIQVGTGFTCTRNSTGNYTITFTTPFAGVPVPVVMPLLTTLLQGAVIDSSSMTLQTVNPSNVATDSAFTFLIVGPR